jgi:hypothetical protein
MAADRDAPTHWRAPMQVARWTDARTDRYTRACRRTAFDTPSRHVTHTRSPHPCACALTHRFTCHAVPSTLRPLCRHFGVRGCVRAPVSVRACAHPRTTPLRTLEYPVVTLAYRRVPSSAPRLHLEYASARTACAYPSEHRSSPPCASPLPRSTTRLHLACRLRTPSCPDRYPTWYRLQCARVRPVSPPLLRVT